MKIRRRSFMAGVAGLLVPRQLVLGEDEELIERPRQYSFIHLPQRERIELRKNGRVECTWGAGHPIVSWYSRGLGVDSPAYFIELVRVTELGGLVRATESVIQRCVLAPFAGVFWQATDSSEVIHARTEVELNDR